MLESWNFALRCNWCNESDSIVLLNWLKLVSVEVDEHVWVVLPHLLWYLLLDLLAALPTAHVAEVCVAWLARLLADHRAPTSNITSFFLPGGGYRRDWIVLDFRLKGLCFKFVDFSDSARRCIVISVESCLESHLFEFVGACDRVLLRMHRLRFPTHAEFWLVVFGSCTHVGVEGILSCHFDDWSLILRWLDIFLRWLGSCVVDCEGIGVRLKVARLFRSRELVCNGLINLNAYLASTGNCHVVVLEKSLWLLDRVVWRPRCPLLFSLDLLGQ